MMMKTIFDTIFAKNTKNSFINTSQSAENIVRPHGQTPNNLVNITKNASANNANKQPTSNTHQEDNEFKNMTFESAYEVAEISLDEFKYTGPERRKFPRKPGETRSCYSKNKPATPSII